MFLAALFGEFGTFTQEGLGTGESVGKGEEFEVELVFEEGA